MHPKRPLHYFRAQKFRRSTCVAQKRRSTDFEALNLLSDRRGRGWWHQPAGHPADHHGRTQKPGPVQPQEWLYFISPFFSSYFCLLFSSFSSHFPTFFVLVPRHSLCLQRPRKGEKKFLRVKLKPPRRDRPGGANL